MVAAAMTVPRPPCGTKAHLGARSQSAVLTVRGCVDNRDYPEGTLAKGYLEHLALEKPFCNCTCHCVCPFPRPLLLARDTITRHHTETVARQNVCHKPLSQRPCNSYRMRNGQLAWGIAQRQLSALQTMPPSFHISTRPEQMRAARSIHGYFS